MEKELKDFKFKGPGWYFTETDSLLVVPRSIPAGKGSDVKIDASTAWNYRWPKGTVFEVNCYNTTLENTIFAAVRYGYIPTRKMVDEEW